MTKSEASEGFTYLETPDKSENDKKIYRTLMLSNGLRALLVSDPSPMPHDGYTSSSSSSSSSYDSTGDSCAEETSSEDSENTSIQNSSESDSTDSDEEGDEKLAACALMVDVGSFSEPREIQGLAHFLEHMIFMGSEKYPLENAFDAHIKKCGGFDNASTEYEETCYYFEVSEKHLDSSLDYFSALLKAPLMKKEAMTRERDAVESEFQQTLFDDEARRDQLLASLASDNYPQSTFAWGNLKTLKENIDDDELYRSLHEFRKRHYSANRMLVVVQARLPVDELESLVLKHFSDVPTNNLTGIDFKQLDYRGAFRDDFHEQVFFVNPVENVSKLELTWLMPPVLEKYKAKPMEFLSHLVGHEGEGSLCAYLKRRLWCFDLVAGHDDGGFETNSIYSLFTVCIYLSEEGFKHLDEVLAATFAFIRILSGDNAKLQENFKELQQIEAVNFRYESQRAAYDNVQNLILGLKYYPPKDILTGPELYFEWNEEQVKEIIDHLNEFRFNLMITSNQKYNGITYDKKEKWFGTEYTTMKMPDKWRQMWENPKCIAELFLPHPNPFVTNDFRVFWTEAGKPDVPLAPKKLVHTNVCELWYRPDDKFLLPEAYMYFYFISPLPRMSAKNDVMCALYAYLLKFRLNEQLYPATTAGLGYQFYCAEKGLVLKVNGYNEKLHLIVDIITKTMVSMKETITEQELTAYKILQKKNYFNSLIKPRTLNKDVRLSILEHIRFPMIDKYRCLNEITLQDMHEFAECYTSQMYIQALMQGNLTEETAHNVMNNVLSTLNCQPIVQTKYIENRTVQIPLGSHYIRSNVLNYKDSNTVVCNFYQIGPSSLRMESILDLLMMFVEEPLFDNLRTKEQLGYYVSSSVRLNYGIAGYSITVNSQESKFSAEHVEQRIEAFRSKMLQILEDMPEDEFNQVRESLIRLKQVVDMSLADEVGRNWGEITCDEYIFDRRRQEVELLRSLEKSDIIAFCVENEHNNLRKLSVQVVGSKEAPLADKQSGEPNVTLSSTVESEDNSLSDEKRNDDHDDNLFDALASKLSMTFIPKENDPTTITNIKEFKQQLHVYPVTKTKVDDNVVPQEIDNSPVTERIEDC